jgi:hypothetical protein
MLYETRIYHCQPGRLPALLDRLAKITLPIWDLSATRRTRFGSSYGISLGVARHLPF